MNKSGTLAPKASSSRNALRTVKPMLIRILAAAVLLGGLSLIAFTALSGDGGDLEQAAQATPNSTAALAPTEAEPRAEASVEPATDEATTSTDASVPEPDNFGQRRDLVNLDGWLNTENTSIDDFDGQVLIVEMWTFGCFNCKNRLPHTQALYEDLQGENFDIIGVHAPEFDFEAEIPRIEQATVDLGVTWPVALDTNKENFRAWQDGGRRFWPRTYVIDQNGDIRFDHIGEGDYEELAKTVRYLLDNPPEPASS